MHSSTHGRWILYTIAGASILCIAMGVRQSFGLFMPQITLDLNISRETFGLAIATQNLLWGAVQPVVGIVADKYGASKIVILGAIFYVSGLLLAAHSGDGARLHIGIGWLTGLGLSACSFAVVLGALGRLVSPDKRTLVIALASTGGSLGQFIMIPVGQMLLASLGWREALIMLGVITALMVPFAFSLKPSLLTADNEADNYDSANATPLTALKVALSHKGYRLLLAGFFVCGFHVVFIAVHLPAYLQDLGFSKNLGALALTVIGFMNIFGTFAWGHWGGKFRKKNSLSVLYLIRSIVLLTFILVPKNQFSVLAFAFCMGATWLGTIPLTSGLVAQLFGFRYLSTLFGLVFFAHQLGAFMGAWLGGWVFVRTGNYDFVWLTAFVLSVIATLLHWRIKDQTVSISVPDRVIAS